MRKLVKYVNHGSTSSTWFLYHSKMLVYSINIFQSQFGYMFYITMKHKQTNILENNQSQFGYIFYILLYHSIYFLFFSAICFIYHCTLKNDYPLIINRGNGKQPIQFDDFSSYKPPFIGDVPLSKSIFQSQLVLSYIH